MTKTQYVMAFDAGTGAGRCVITDVQGHFVSSAYAEWGYTAPPKAPEYGQAFDPEEFWAILARLSREAIAKGKVDPAEIVGVSTTSQREGMVFIDDSGKEIYAGPNVDGRGFAEAQQLQPIAEEVRSITGLRPFGLYGLSRLGWFKKHDPATYDRIHRVMMISDWIAYRLSGVPSSEPSVASSSQLLNLAKRNWSQRVMELGELRTDIYPPVYEAGTRIGSVTQQAAKDTGLAAGAAVAAGGGDTQIGLLGMNLTEPNQIGAVAGTSTPLMLILNQVLVDSERRVSTNCYVLPDRWTLESNAGMTGMPYRWVRDTFAQAETQTAEEQGGDPYEYLNEQAAEVGPGAGGVMAFIGSGAAGRTRNSNLGGFVFPISWILDHYDRRHFYRAALETMAYGIRTNADQLAEIVDIKMDRIDVCGGQTKSGLFNQVLANTMNTPAYIYEVKEATCLGAGICAAVGAGEYSDPREGAEAMVRIEQVVDPQPEKVPEYQDAYNRWVAVSKYLSDFPG
jgi:autoinducer 2 (AI-2) kinase